MFTGPASDEGHAGTTIPREAYTSAHMRARLLKLLAPVVIPAGLLLVWAAAESVLTRPFFRVPATEEIPLGPVILLAEQQQPKGHALDVDVLGHLGSRTFALTVDGPLLYFGVGQSIAILDISDPVNPVVVGQSKNMPDVPLNIAVRGGYAYVAAGGSGLRIYDVGEPSSLSETGFYKTSGEALSVAVVGHYAYVAVAQASLVILDVANPAKPVAVGSHKISGLVRRVLAKDRYMFVIGSAGLNILDVSDPVHPRDVGGYGGLGTFAQDIVVSIDSAYIADGAWGLAILDITDVAKPAIQRLYDTPGAATGVAFDKHYVFVADRPFGLRVFDAEDADKLTEAGFYDARGEFWAVAVRDGYAYVARGEAGLWVIRFTQA